MPTVVDHGFCCAIDTDSANARCPFFSRDKIILVLSFSVVRINDLAGSGDEQIVEPVIVVHQAVESVHRGVILLTHCSTRTIGAEIVQQGPGANLEFSRHQVPMKVTSTVQTPV